MSLAITRWAGGRNQVEPLGECDSVNKLNQVLAYGGTFLTRSEPIAHYYKYAFIFLFRNYEQKRNIY